MSGILVAFVVALLTSSWLFLRRYRNRHEEKHVPPGSTGLPLIGDTVQFLYAFKYDKLHAFYEKKAKKYGPVFRMSLFGDNFALLDVPDGDKFIFANELNEVLHMSWPKGTDVLFGPSSLLFKNGKDHQVCRRHMVRTFLGPEVIIKYVAKMERNAVEHFDKYWSGSNEVCVRDMMKEYTVSLISDLLMSVTDADDQAKLRREFRVWTAAVVSLPVSIPGTAFHRGMQAKEAIFDMMHTFIQRRKEELKQGTARPDQDLLSVLLTEPDEEGHMFTDADIRDNLIFLLFGGHDSSSSALELTIRYLAKYPEVYKAVIEEQAAINNGRDQSQPLQVDDLRQMKYTWRVVLESIRMHPIISVGFREATKDFEYKGYTIPKGWKVLWTLPRSKGLFEDQEKFDPTRFERPQKHIFQAFGGGPHFCPGAEFARLEILTFLHHLVKNYRWSLVYPNEKIIRNLMPQTPKGTPIRITKRTAF